MRRFGCFNSLDPGLWKCRHPIENARDLGRMLGIDLRIKTMSESRKRDKQEWGIRYSSGVGVGAVAFRTSLTLASDGMATLVWLRAGELAVVDRDLPKFDKVPADTAEPEAPFRLQAPFGVPATSHWGLQDRGGRGGDR